MNMMYPVMFLTCPNLAHLTGLWVYIKQKKAGNHCRSLQLTCWADSYDCLMSLNVPDVHHMQSVSAETDIYNSQRAICILCFGS